MSGSMLGSGIYDSSVDYEIVCNESSDACDECAANNKVCLNVWTEAINTSGGEIDCILPCPACGHGRWIKRDS